MYLLYVFFVIKFEFTDYTSKFRFWWIVIRDGDSDVCMKDPGFEVDLTISSDLKTLTAAWIGDLTIGRATREKKIILSGSTDLKKHISTWLGTNYYADVRSMR